MLRFTPDAAIRHRVHIRGAVTLLWPGRVICVEDAGAGLCARTAQTTPLQPGELADVIGFPETGEFAPTLENAIYRGDQSRSPLTPAAVTAAQALDGEFDARLVTLEGQFISRDWAAINPTLMVSSGKYIFPVVLPRSLVEGGPPPDWEEGSLIRITGVCSVKSDANQRAGGGAAHDPREVGSRFRNRFESRWAVARGHRRGAKTILVDSQTFVVGPGVRLHDRPRRARLGDGVAKPDSPAN